MRKTSQLKKALSLLIVAVFAFDAFGFSFQVAHANPLLDADIQITKTDGLTTVNPGQTVTYTLTATNHGGPAAAQNVHIFETFPATYMDFVGTTGCGGATPAAGTHIIDCALGDIAVDQSVSVTVTGTVKMTARGTITNDARVNGENDSTVGPTCPQTSQLPDCNQAQDKDVIVVLPSQITADVQVIKTDGVSTVNQGQTVNYLITVINVGPDAAPNTQITDTIPATLQNASWSCQSNCGLLNTTSGTGNVNTIANLGNGQSVTIQVTATVNPEATETIVNTATAAVAQGIVDPNSTNNSATDTDQVIVIEPIGIPFLTLTKTASPSPVTAGSQLTYTITATNTGTATANHVTIDDTLNANLTFVSVTPSSDCTYTTNTRNVHCDFATLARNTDQVVTIVTTVSGTFTEQGTISNTAQTSFDGHEGARIFATATSTINPAPAEPLQADLSITKTAAPSSPKAGDSLTYTLVVTNNSQNPATAVVVTDQLPSTVTFVSQGTSSACTVSQTTTGLITCTASTLAAGASATFTVVTTINAGTTGTISNTATVASALTDPASGNNSSTATTSVAATPVVTPNPEITGNPTVAPAPAPTPTPSVVSPTPTTSGITETSTETVTNQGNETPSTETVATLADTGSNASTPLFVSAALLLALEAIRRYRKFA